MPTLEDMFYHAVDGVFAVDSRQRIIFWDSGCEELFGRSSQWVLGRPCHTVICGKNSSNGSCFCREGCVVAKSPEHVSAPNNFKIRTKDKNNQPLMLSVDIVLVPGFCKRKWIVTHLLHRNHSQDVLTMIDTNSYKMQMPHANSAQIDGCTPTNRLTERENEVIQLLAEGLSSLVIARRLGISHTTIRNHIQHIQHKLNVHSQAEAVAYAYRHNLVH